MTGRVKDALLEALEALDQAIGHLVQNEPEIALKRAQAACVLIGKLPAGKL